MRLTDERILEMFRGEAMTADDNQLVGNVIIATVRRCLALAALPDAPSDYADRERRGFEVSQPGELPK